MEKKNLRTCVGGILFLIAAILSTAAPMINHAIITMNTNKHVFPADVLQSMLTTVITTTITTLVFSIPSIILAIFLMMKKNGTPLVVISVIMLVGTVFSTGITLLGRIISSIAGYTTPINFHMLVIILVDILFLILVINTRKEPRGRFAKLWFLPGVAYCGYVVVYVIYTFLYNSSMNPGIDTAILLGIVSGVLLQNMPAILLRGAGYFLAGHWLSNPYKKGYQPQQQYAQPQYAQPQYAAQYQQPQQYQPYGQPQQPQYDEQTTQALNYYKWQYESGAITWEQYNACVQQLLGR